MTILIWEFNLVTEIGLEIPPYDDGTSGEDRVGELASSDSGYRRLISAIVQNPAMNQKFNLLWEDSINHEKYNNGSMSLGLGILWMKSFLGSIIQI